MAAPQVCSRCRKRRIRCDLQLPTCRNCRVADVECVFWDDALRQEVPCSYLYSLRQRVASLQHELHQHADRNGQAAEPLTAGQQAEMEDDFFLSRADDDDALAAPHIAYLGPNSAARLLEKLIKSFVHGHAQRHEPVPGRLAAGPAGNLPRTSHLPAFPVGGNPRKADLPLSTQRALIEHYMAVVAPEHRFLPIKQETDLLGYDNPLRWSHAHKDDLGAHAVTIVFAVATALVARDIDIGLAGVAAHFRDDLQRLVLDDKLCADDPVEATRWRCIAFCASALCEMIAPASGQLWEILGGAVSLFGCLREAYCLAGSGVDEDFCRLERAVLQLERQVSISAGCKDRSNGLLTQRRHSSVALHFRRHSSLSEVWHQPALVFGVGSPADVPLSDSLDVLHSERRIRRALSSVASRPPPAVVESVVSIIPPALRVHAADADISIHSATLYVAVHPLFTSPDIFLAGPLPDSAQARLFLTVARAAGVLIDLFAERNENKQIVSLWMAAERVLESGLVWAVYLVYQRPAAQAVGENVSTDVAKATAMDRLHKVTELLASFAARWRAGGAYVEGWNTFLELLWDRL